MRSTPQEAAAQIIAHYGAQNQLVKLCEECGELIQQAAKCYDKGISYSADMIEEMADVQIMLMQFRRILPNYWYDRLYEIQRQKLDRQLQRIESEVHNDP